MGVPTIRDREEAKKRSRLDSLPTMVEDASTLEHIGSCLPNVMRETPPQDTYLQKIMGFPATHRRALHGVTETWAFDRPE